MIGEFLSTIIIIAALVFFATLASFFALVAIRKYEVSRRYERKVELIRRISVSSRKARRNSKVLSTKTPLYRTPSMNPFLNKSKVRDLSKRAKFRRAFKLSIVIPEEDSDQSTGRKGAHTKVASPVPLWSPSTLEIALRKVVKDNFASDSFFAKSPKHGSPKAKGGKVFFPDSPKYFIKGPDGDAWTSKDMDASLNDGLGRTNVATGRNSQDKDNETTFYSRYRTLGTWMLETCSMAEPVATKWSTASFTIKWDQTIISGETTVLEYDLQCRVKNKNSLESLEEGYNSESSDGDFKTESIWVDPRGHKSKRVFFECRNSFKSIPRAAFDGDLDKVVIQGLSEHSQGLQFRVRMKGFAGWGPFSRPSAVLFPLPSSTFAPDTGAITSRGIEVRWQPLKDLRYGKTIRYTLSGKQAGDDTFCTIFIGRGTVCVVQALGNKALIPNTTYVFKLLIKTEGGDVNSKLLPVTTFAAAPEPPISPVVGTVTSSSVHLSWFPPCDNGAPIIRYVLYGRRQRSNRFKRLYTGNESEYNIGGSHGQGQLAPDTVYIFKLKATNVHGDSPTSATVSVTTLSLTVSPERGAGDGSGPNSPILSSPVALGRRRSSAGGPQGRRDSFITTSIPTIDSVSPGGQQVARRNSVTSPTVSTAPARVSELPNGWVECWDPQRENCYYYNSMTGITQWMHPTKGDSTDPELPFRKKRFKLLYSLRERDWPKGGRKIIKITLRRQHLVQDSFQALERLGVEKLKLKTKIVFEGEDGIDSGGLTKDWFLQLSRGLFNPQFCLLKQHESKVYHIDSRSGINEEHLKYFHFFGNFLAKAIYDRQLVDVPFCKMIYKHLLGLPATLGDLADIDPVYHTSLKWMLNNDIDGIIDETFSITVDNFGERITVDLKKGGRNIEVTDKNKGSYVQAVVNWQMGGAMKLQIDNLRKGFYEIVPIHEIADFTPDELSLLLNGKHDIDVNEMASQSKYTGGYDKNSTTIQFFWVAVKSFSKEERGKLLQFATGTSRAPLDGFDPAFTVTRAEGVDENALPTAHTCFNQLVLPEYKSVETLMAKLRYAFDSSEGFMLT